MKSADSAAEQARQAGGPKLAGMTPQHAGGWVLTLVSWIGSIVQSHDSPGASVIRSVAITLTLICVMLACYDGLRRAQQAAARRILARQDEIAERMEATLHQAIVDLTSAAASQQDQVRRMRRRLANAARKREAHRQECTDELGARLQNLAELVEAQSLLFIQEREAPPIPRPARAVNVVTALADRR